MQLLAAGAHLDDIRYCAKRPDAATNTPPGKPSWRKPALGMLLDLMRARPIVAQQSFVVGDKQSDMDAAANAGLIGLRFPGGDLHQFLAPYLVRQNG
jgi:D-glycero-D-manno-heptose 1,7-bisphosphate phosphatase